MHKIQDMIFMQFVSKCILKIVKSIQKNLYLGRDKISTTNMIQKCY